MKLNAALIASVILSITGCDSNGSSSAVIQVAWKAEAPPDIAGRNGNPATDGERFFVLGRHLVAYEVTSGDQVWAVSPSRSTIPFYMAVRGGRIFLAEGEAVALDAATGRELWRTSLAEDASLAEPGADERAFYTVDSRGRVYAFGTATGVERWTADIGAGWWKAFGTGVASADGFIYVGVERGYAPSGALSQGVVVALDATTGREIWRYVNGDGTDSRSVIGAPVVSGDVLVLSDSKGGAYIGIDRATGRERWKVVTGATAPGPGRAMVVVDGIGYGAPPDTHVYAIDVATGRVVWKASPRDASSGFYHAVCGSTVISNNVSIIVTDRATGRTIKGPYRPDGQGATSGFAVAGNRAFYVTEKNVVALDCPP